MRILTFSQILDSRFCENNKEEIVKIEQQLKAKLNIEGVKIKSFDIRKIDFGDCTQYRQDYFILKTTRRITWNDIYKIVNSVRATPYTFRNNINIDIFND